MKPKKVNLGTFISIMIFINSPTVIIGLKTKNENSKGIFAKKLFFFQLKKKLTYKISNACFQKNVDMWLYQNILQNYIRI